MDNTVRETITTFLAQYDTLAIATEYQGQPYVTRVFYTEQLDTTLALYATFITPSRKLANLQHNPRVGLFIGPQQPTIWLEATAQAHTITDGSTSAAVREQLCNKSAVAAAFIARVPTVVIELQVNWLRITNVAANPMRIEATFTNSSAAEEKNA